jgi:beta-lactamase superfamily II metal-dependent hydrolase
MLPVTSIKFLGRLRWLILLVPLLLGISPGESAPIPVQISITFIDVGQGDATLIRDGAGFDILVDGGNKSAGDRVINHIQAVGVDDLEIVLATHADRDHIGGLITLLESDEILVENVYYNGYPGDTQTWGEFEDAAAADGLLLLPLQFPLDQAWGRFNVKVLNPPGDLVDPEQNDASVVLLVDYAQMRFLLPGDIDSGIEQLLPGRSSNLQSDILKVAHHGSKFSSSQAFLEIVRPDEAIISAGLNAYGHPAPETLERLVDIGTRIGRTDILGTITLLSNGSSYEIYPKITYLPLLLRFSEAPISP